MAATTVCGNAIKKAVSLACLLAVLSVCLPDGVNGDNFNIANGRHNITMGQRKYTYPRDYLLFHDTFNLQGSSFPYPKVQSNDVCYPPTKGGRNSPFSITAFNVTDTIPRGEGGYVFITQGGINSGKLCLHLKTQRGKGYRFNVDIWGYYI